MIGDRGKDEVRGCEEAHIVRQAREGVGEGQVEEKRSVKKKNPCVGNLLHIREVVAVRLNDPFGWSGCPGCVNIGRRVVTTELRRNRGWLGRERIILTN